MRQFIVKRKEVHIQDIKIGAENKEAALALVGDIHDHGVYGEMYYHSTLDPDTWEVVELDPEIECSCCENEIKSGDAVLYAGALKLCHLCRVRIGTGMSEPTEYHECGCCGDHHRATFTGCCRDDENRFSYERLTTMGVSAEKIIGMDGLDADGAAYHE